MAKIFISYRRGDSQYQADKLYGALKPYVKDPKSDIFIDVDNIPFGVDFATYLESKVSQCDILLALMGDEWLTASDPKSGARRLDDPADFVRIEIASALKRGVPVVPVLFDGVKVPAEQDLPDDLKALARRNGIPVSRTSFASDVARLVEGLPVDLPGKRRAKAIAEARPADSAVVLGVSVLVAIGTLGAAAYLFLADPFRWNFSRRADLAESAAPIAAGAPIDEQAVEDPGADSGEIRSAVSDVVSRDGPSEVASGAEQQIPAVDVGVAADQAQPELREPDRTSLTTEVSYNPGDVFRDKFRSGDGQGPELVVVASGSFAMGSPASEDGHQIDEEPVRTVQLGAPLAVGRFEITWEEYQACVEDGGCIEAEDDGFGKRRRPVTQVSRNDALAYTKWLTLKTGAEYRLLTEAEWEYAARAGTKGRFSNDGAEADLCNIANGADAFTDIPDRNTACSDGTGNKSAPVGAFAPNDFGLYDMHGNVWEWVEDCYVRGYAGAPTDGSARKVAGCKQYVVRGGSWNFAPALLRSASRDQAAPGNRVNIIGFRVARTIG